MNSKSLLFSVTIVIQSLTKAFSQSLPPKTIWQIDSLFSTWTSNTSPGCTIGIVRNDTLVYAKGYGMANLEYDVANTPETIFHVASISKQFTAWSVLLLAREGKLNLTDDIHKYLPCFPDLKAKITIQHLLNHTSGIRDQWQLLAISGTRLDDVVTQDQIIKVLAKQRALNFTPGDQYNYSSSGYTMLAEIVKSVTGQTLRQFADSAIFKPLKMTNTHFHDNGAEIVRNRSYSYNRMEETHFTNSTLSCSTAGATGLLTNIVDLAVWVTSLCNPVKADQQTVEMLTKKLALNSGERLTYASGITVNTFKGWKQYAHGGSDAGFRTHMAVFPEKKMGFVVLSNVGDFDPDARVHALADLFLEENKMEPKRESAYSPARVLADTLGLAKLAGNYIGDDGLPLSFEKKGTGLYSHLFDQTALLQQDSPNNFSLGGADRARFIFKTDGKDTTVDVKAADQCYHLDKYT
ncbi:serine hydrolase domain-containing protein [Salmonirosea aquatica]|uniref:Serine hydrolase n=1 Tax=Salmonirosea aquatica TaxID=2654236 RepID=A0A7C9BEL2_9BACT|nr:serine hydrolase [Cytophagaceae bacterium SJW1-29]